MYNGLRTPRKGRGPQWRPPCWPFATSPNPDLAEVQAAISKVPFLWSEDALKGGVYTATLCAPLSDLLAVSTYISRVLPTFASKVESWFVSPADSRLFNHPHNIYQDGEWKFSIQQIGTALRKESGLSGKPRTKPI